MDGRIFNITGVARDDLLALFPQYKDTIAKLSDTEMDYLAGKMADGYLDCCFWIQLCYLGEEILKNPSS